MTKNVKQELKDIRQALDEHSSSDSSKNEAAQRLRKDIDHYLEHSHKTTEQEHTHMLAGLKRSIEQFEASHPTLGLMIEKFLDTLSNLGI